MSNEIVPIIKNLVEQGNSITDIGILLGFTSDNTKDLIWGETTVLQEAALANLVSTAYKLATGFETEDETIEYVNSPKYNEVNGQRVDKWIPGKKTVTRKQYKPDNAALKLLLQSKLAGDFQQVNLRVKRNLNKPDSVEGQVMTSAGRLLEELRVKKKVDSKETR